jgi:hypothetical protein
MGAAGFAPHLCLSDVSGRRAIEEIARLAGHNRTATTELVYRRELRPVITTGAEVMDRILSREGSVVT